MTMEPLFKVLTVLEIFGCISMGLIVLIHYDAAGQSFIEQQHPHISQYTDKERGLLAELGNAGNFTTKFITHIGNMSIAIFIGPDNTATTAVKQPTENTTSQIAERYGFKTLVYEYGAEDQLIIILFSSSSTLPSEIYYNVIL
jgi:hypothetical protein